MAAVSLARLPDDDDLLSAEPTTLTGVLVGYARVSTGSQRLDRQHAALEAAGCARIFSDTESGKTMERPELAATMDYLRAGDTLVVPSLDRLSRSLQDLIQIVADLRRRGIGFRSLKESIDTTTAGGRLIFHVFAALAEFIRELIVEGTNEGLAAARARGVRLGRPPAMTPEQIAHARAMLTDPKATVSSIARLLGISRSTIYKYLPELRGAHGGKLPAGRAPAPAIEAATVGRDDVDQDVDQAAEPGADDGDLDEVFDVLADLAEELRGELEGELGAALAEPGAVFLAAWERQAGDGDLSEVARAAWRVLDGLADYRYAPATPQALIAAADRLIDLLPVRQDDGRPGGQDDDGPLDAPAAESTVAAGVAEVKLARLGGGLHLLLADGDRAGWLREDADGWQVHDSGGRQVAVLARGELFGVARQAAAALGVALAPGAQLVAGGNLGEWNGHQVDPAPSALASWTLLRGRVPGRQDVIVRGRCVGWIQHHPRGGYTACTLAGPIPGPAARTREEAVLALFTAMYAPAPLNPDQTAAVLARRSPKARPRTDKPLPRYSERDLALAADRLPARPGPDGAYPVVVDGEQLGTIGRTGRHWQATTPAGRTVVHRAATRTEAVDGLLAVPGPLFGDPADTVVLDLADR